MSAITAKESRKMKKYAVLTREPRCFLGSFDFSWEQRRFFELYERVSRKNDLTYGRNDIISVANMYFKPDSYITDDSYLLTYNIFELGDIAFEGNKSKNYAHGRFVENTIGNGIVSHVFDVFKPIMNPYDLLFWKYAINNERLMGSVLLRSTKASTMMTNLVATDFLQESFLVPTYPEQQKIGAFFQQLDNLITLHQRKYADLCSPSQVVFSLLFATSTFSWEQRKLSEMCGTFEYGLNAAAKEFDGKNKYIRITDIDDASREFLLSDLSSPDICLDGMSKYLLSSGDIVFARTGASVGKTYIYRENDGIVYFAGFLIRAKVNQDNDAEFVFQSTLSPSYEKYIRITSQRSGQPGVNAQEYGEYDLFAPSKEEQQRIGRFLRGIDNLITLHQRKFEKLTNVKKSMLEKKWIAPLIESIHKLPDTVIDSLVGKIQALQNKYATTFFEVEQQISETEATLSGMIDDLEGNEYDMLGLNELKKLLGGSAE